VHHAADCGGGCSGRHGRARRLPEVHAGSVSGRVAAGELWLSLSAQPLAYSSAHRVDRLPSCGRPSRVGPSRLCAGAAICAGAFRTGARR
jgi:hypothetical protein